VDRSLVQAEEHVSGERYRLLEPIRQYAQEHLTALGEREAVRARHAAHYLELAEQAAEALWGSHVTGPFGSAAQVEWQARLEREHDNLRAGLAWAEEDKGPENLARWCTALWVSGSCTAISTNVGVGWRQRWRPDRECRPACAPGYSGRGG